MAPVYFWLAPVASAPDGWTSPVAYWWLTVRGNGGGGGLWCGRGRRCRNRGLCSQLPLINSPSPPWRGTWSPFQWGGLAYAVFDTIYIIVVPACTTKAATVIPHHIATLMLTSGALWFGCVGAAVCVGSVARASYCRHYWLSTAELGARCGLSAGRL